MDYVGKHELEVLEEMAPGYNRFLALKFQQVFQKYKGGDESSILDFGAGIGSLAVELQKIGYQNIDCLEIDQKMSKFIEQRGLKSYNEISQLKHKYQFVYMSNVLEHIEDDFEILKTIKEQILEDRSLLIIYVPAFNVLFSNLDIQVGHYRRYTIKSLEKIIKSVGYSVEQKMYVDSLGFISLFMLKYLFRQKISVSQNKLLILIYDKILFPISRLLDLIGLKFLFGKNIFLVARNSDTEIYD